MPIQIYLKIASRRKFSIQPNDVNISCDVTSFFIDKHCSDAIMPAYQKRFEE